MYTVYIADDILLVLPAVPHNPYTPHTNHLGKKCIKSQNVYSVSPHIGYHSHQAQGYPQHVCTACLLKMHPEYQDRLSENA
jgi:hypothetical protein